MKRQQFVEVLPSFAAPSPATERGSPTLVIGGLRLPLRETLIVAITTFVLLIEYYHDLAPASLPSYLGQSLDRALLYGALPFVALLALGERPADYGLRVGAWRVGLPVMAAGMLVATPIILVAAGALDFQAYYGRAAVDPGTLLLANALDGGAAEFLYRGFLMMALVRLCGPIGVVLATFPFVFMHLGKPELETLSTLVGGTAFGWMVWRTGSILYSATLHAYLMTLVVFAASR
jgi:membrane protease YdiL (CAAX protease family)